MQSLQGVIHGRVIELDGEAGLPDGQRVSIVLVPMPADVRSPRQQPLDNLRNAFGSWASEAAEVDEYLQWNRRQRKLGRREV